MTDVLPHGIIPIDTLMTGRDRVTCAYLLDGTELVLIEAGPATSAAAVRAGLATAGIDPDALAHIVLTHVHLDHAGGAGHLAVSFPRAHVWIHERAAPHLANPERLVASASRIYGTDGLRTTLGLPRPVASERLQGLRGGERLRFGDRELIVLPTPGHASTHLALQDASSGAIFAGDAVGVHLPDSDIVRPAAPPPEFDLEAAIASIASIRTRARGTLLLAHFGAATDVDAICGEAERALHAWASAARRVVVEGGDEARAAEALAAVAGAREQTLLDEERERFEIIGSIRMNALGLHRYWRKHLERSGRPGGPAADQES